MSTRNRLIIAAAACLLSQPAIADGIGNGINGGVNGGISVGAGGGVAFVGLADLVPSPIACWSLRACSAALRGTRAVQVCNPGDSSCVDWVTDAVTGDLVPTLIGGSSCGVIVCTIKTVYDQMVGASSCGGVPCDVTMASNRPVLTLSCNDIRACATSTGASAGWTSATNLSAFSQPITISAVAERVTGGQQNIITDRAAFDMGFNAAPNTTYLYENQLSSSATANDGVIHAMQGLYNNGAASSLYIDGALQSVGAVGSNAFGGAKISIASGNNGPLQGKWSETAMWAATFSGAQNIAVNGNQHGYWRF